MSSDQIEYCGNCEFYADCMKTGMSNCKFDRSAEEDN